MERERVLCAAMWFDDGKVYPQQPVNIPSGYVVSGFDHESCEALTKIFCSPVKCVTITGFLTSTNCFLAPEEASVLAHQKGQISSPVKQLTTKELYS